MNFKTLNTIAITIGVVAVLAGTSAGARADDSDGFYATRLKHALQDAESAADSGDFQGMRDAISEAQHDRRMIEYGADED